jgi:hypothetical protein
MTIGYAGVNPMLFFWMTSAIAATEPFVAPDPPGPWIHLRPDDLRSAAVWHDDAPILGTYFFYWYDVDTKEHWLNGDGSDALVDHPTRPDGFSYRNPDWWERELRDVMDAGVDFIAPVYWGVPGQYESGPFEWSFAGLRALVPAWEHIAASGARPPQVALFYDTSTLQHNGEGRHIDMTTDEGKDWFYTTIRDFFALIPPKMWAMRKGGPIVLLYSSAFAKAQSPDVFPYLDRRFREDFACEPFVAREISWQGDTDAVVAWGGALGLKPFSVASLGPGYDHHAVPGRDPLVVDRENGAFYRRNWERFLNYDPNRRAKIVIVETWNELHEGTDVCDTVEYGRKYIELTAEYAARYKANERIRSEGATQDVQSVEWTSSTEPKATGLTLRSGGDGVMTPVVVDGVRANRTAPSRVSGGRYAYFDLDPAWAFDVAHGAYRIEIAYLDAGCDAFEFHYDSTDNAGSVREGAFKSGGRIPVGDTKTWKTATFRISDARFADRCNGSDMRFAALGGASELTVRRVIVTRE